VMLPAGDSSFSSGALDCLYSLWYKAPAMLPAGDSYLSSGALDCLYSLWYKAPAMLPAGDKYDLTVVTSKQHRQCITPQAVNTI